MTSPTLPPISPPKLREFREKGTSIAYDRVLRGNSEFKNDTTRQRTGKINYSEYVIKAGGYAVLNTVSGVTGGGKGGLRWIDVDTTGTDRTRIIYALENKVYLYSVANNTRVELRDIETIDSKTITFLSSVQIFDDGWFVIGDSTISAKLYKYSGTTSGAITAFADAGGGEVTVTDVAHGMQTGNTVTIIGTTSYNGTFVITKVDADNFKITDTWVADDATGTWTGETMTEETATGLNASRIINELDNRLMASNMGSDSARVQYSKLSTTDITTFTSSTDTDGGGLLSGSVGSVTAMAFTKGIGLVFELNRITAHTIGSLTVGNAARIKDTVTINEEVTIDGKGVASQKAVTIFDDLVVFISKDGLFVYDPISRRSENRLVNLTKKFQPMLQDFDLSNSSIAGDSKRNRIYFTAASQTDIAQNFVFTYDRNTKSLAFDPSKAFNQLFYDDLTEKVFGLSSSGSDLVELYNGGFTNDDDEIALEAETRQYDFDDPLKEKRFNSLSCMIAASSGTQSFLFEYFVDDNDSADFSETVSVESLIQKQGSVFQAFANSVWGSGTPSTANSLVFIPYFFDGLVSNFRRFSLRITETSSAISGVGQPQIRYNHTNTKSDAFTT